jgi:hypothetical protein
MRRTTISAMDPDIAMAVPAVIARHPDITWAWSGYDFNRTRRRRTNADNDLRIGSADR